MADYDAPRNDVVSPAALGIFPRASAVAGVGHVLDQTYNREGKTTILPEFHEGDLPADPPVHGNKHPSQDHLLGQRSPAIGRWSLASERTLLVLLFP